MMTLRQTWDDRFWAALHELVGRCGHCGKRKCSFRASWSILPPAIPVEDLNEAIKKAKGGRP